MGRPASRAISGSSGVYPDAKPAGSLANRPLASWSMPSPAGSMDANPTSPGSTNIPSLSRPCERIQLLNQLDAFFCIGMALLMKKAPKYWEGNTCMHNGQEQEIYRETTKHPLGAIHRECGGVIRQQCDHQCRNQAGCDLHVLQKSLKT